MLQKNRPVRLRLASLCLRQRPVTFGGQFRFAGKEPPFGTGYVNRVRRSGLIEAGHQNRVLKSEILCRTIHRMTVSSAAEEKPLHAINQGPADLC